MLNTEPARRIAIRSPSNRSRPSQKCPPFLNRRYRLTHHSRSEYRHQAGSPGNDYVLHIFYSNRRQQYPFKRSASLASFSPADNAQGLPITFANENRVFHPKADFHIPAKIEVNLEFPRFFQTCTIQPRCHQRKDRRGEIPPYFQF